MTTLTIEFHNAEDAEWVRKFVQESIQERKRLQGHRAGILQDCIAKAKSVSIEPKKEKAE